MVIPVRKGASVDEKIEAAVRETAEYSHDRWLTVRELARRFRVRQDTVIDIIEGSTNMDLIVGFRVGNGIGEFDTKGDYQAEWIG